MNNDKLVVCPRCEGNACYGNKVTEEITTWHCFGCGFCTNSLMKEGEEFFDKQSTVLPELYKDLLFVDENGLLNILNPVIKSKSTWKPHALYLMAEYYLANNQKQKSKEFFNKIVILENISSKIKLKAQKRLRSDFSE